MVYLFELLGLQVQVFSKVSFWLPKIINWLVTDIKFNPKQKTMKNTLFHSLNLRDFSMQICPKDLFTHHGNQNCLNLEHLLTQSMLF